MCQHVKNCKTQRNFYKQLLKTTKKSYFDTLYTKTITDNKTFWKNILPLFTQKKSKGKQNILIEKQNVISNDKELCSAFKDFFANVMSNLNRIATAHSHSSLQNTDPILATVNSYHKQPSTERIKNSSCNTTFNLRKNYSNEISKVIDNLNIKKTWQNSDIPTKIIKLNKDIIASFISEKLQLLY